jgi:hypothetical protein
VSAPTTPDFVTLRLPRDVAREYLRALEELISEADDASTFIELISEADDASTFIVRHVSRGHDATDLINAVTETQPLRDALHAALYCEVTS